MINIPPMAERIKKRREHREAQSKLYKSYHMVIQEIQSIPKHRSIWNLWGLL